MKIVVKSLERKAMAAMGLSGLRFILLGLIYLWMVLFGVCGVHGSYQWDGYRIWDK